MSRIVWLASFPKSGNTWIRVFLSNYLQDGEAEADINRLKIDFVACGRVMFDLLAGVEASDLTRDEIDRCLPRIYRGLAAQGGDPVFVKVHSAYACNSAGQPLFPADVTAGVVYIVRNPLDVAVSLSHHQGTSIDSAVNTICRSDFGLANSSSRLPEQLYQAVGSWSDHVRSWVDQADVPVHVVRYEDIKGDPHRAFHGVVKASGLAIDDARVHRAEKLSRFDRLKAQEEQAGFAERPPAMTAFFRKGIVGDWREALTAAQVRRVVRAHGDTMYRFGYLAEDRKTIVDTANTPQDEAGFPEKSATASSRTGRTR